MSPTLLIAALLLGCSDNSSNKSQALWSLTEAHQKDGLLLSAWSSGGPLWMVGGRPERTTVLHGSDAAFTRLDTPGSALAWWICGLGETPLVVGDNGLALLYLGDGAWEQLELEVTTTLFGCAGQSPDDFWVVGGDPIDGPALVVHVRDRIPQRIEPDVLPQVPPLTWFKAWLGEERLVIVGDDGGTLVHPLGSSPEADWTFERIANGNPLFTVAGRNDEDVWAVGGRSQGLVAHYDGQAWTATPIADAPGLLGLSVPTSGTITAVGERGSIYEYQNEEWSRVEPFTDATFHAVWQDSTGTPWAVGGNVNDPDSDSWYGVIAKR